MKNDTSYSETILAESDNTDPMDSYPGDTVDMDEIKDLISQ